MPSEAYLKKKVYIQKKTRKTTMINKRIRKINVK